MRSRVTPAVGSTIAIRRPASQLNSDDFPTLGRPTIATRGTGMVVLHYTRKTVLYAFPASGRRQPAVTGVEKSAGAGRSPGYNTCVGHRSRHATSVSRG